MSSTSENVDHSVPNDRAKTHIESLQRTRSSILVMYAKQKEDLLHQLEEVDKEINSERVQYQEIQSNSLFAL